MKICEQILWLRRTRSLCRLLLL